MNGKGKINNAWVWAFIVVCLTLNFDWSLCEARLRPCKCQEGKMGLKNNNNGDKDEPTDELLHPC